MSLLRYRNTHESTDFVDQCYKAYDTNSCLYMDPSGPHLRLEVGNIAKFFSGAFMQALYQAAQRLDKPPCHSRMGRVDHRRLSDACDDGNFFFIYTYPPAMVERGTGHLTHDHIKTILDFYEAAIFHNETAVAIYRRGGCLMVRFKPEDIRDQDFYQENAFHQDYERAIYLNYENHYN